MNCTSREGRPSLLPLVDMQVYRCTIYTYISSCFILGFLCQLVRFVQKACMPQSGTLLLLMHLPSVSCGRLFGRWRSNGGAASFPGRHDFRRHVCVLLEPAAVLADWLADSFFFCCYYCYCCSQGLPSRLQGSGHARRLSSMVFDALRASVSRLLGPTRQICSGILLFPGEGTAAVSGRCPYTPLLIVEPTEERASE